MAAAAILGVLLNILGPEPGGGGGKGGGDGPEERHEERIKIRPHK
jgi:hypothetical protein